MGAAGGGGTPLMMTLMAGSRTSPPRPGGPSHLPTSQQDVISLLTSSDEDEDHEILAEPRRLQQSLLDHLDIPGNDSPEGADNITRDLFQEFFADDFYHDRGSGSSSSKREEEGDDDADDDEIIHSAGCEHIDLTGEVIPFFGMASSSNNNVDSGSRAIETYTIPDDENDDTEALAVEVEFTEPECLAKFLDVFPDIAHDHVSALFHSRVADGAVTDLTWCEHAIGCILDSGSYPKATKIVPNKKKRKRDDDDDDDNDQGAVEVHGPDWEISGATYLNHAEKILGEEFSDIPLKHISNTLRVHKTLFAAFGILETQQREFKSQEHPPYRRLRRPAKRLKGTALGTMPPDRRTETLKNELEAAKKKKEKEEDKRRRNAEKEQKEKENEKIARMNNEIAECGCCFAEYPTNRMTFCDGEQIHFFCYDCATKHVESIIGQMRCTVKCIAMSGCEAEFTRRELLRFLELRTFEKLEQLQAQESIRQAGIQGLEECPFCNYQAVCPPAEVDREFRCLNGECEKISCRLCHKETHVPKSCEEHARDNRLSIRHTLEEAMTEAMVRTCNKCKNRFVKEYGCNKMVCPTCRNMQCYVCSQTVRDYSHFENTSSNHTALTAASGKCPLYDNTAARHDDEVKKAEAAVLERIRTDNPGITDEDLEIKVSEQVRREEEQRIQAANGIPPAPAPMQVLPIMAMPPPPPPPPNPPVNRYVPFPVQLQNQQAQQIPWGALGRQPPVAARIPIIPYQPAPALPQAPNNNNIFGPLQGHNVQAQPPRPLRQEGWPQQNIQQPPYIPWPHPNPNNQYYFPMNNVMPGAQFPPPPPPPPDFNHAVVADQYMPRAQVQVPLQMPVPVPPVANFMRLNPEPYWQGAAGGPAMPGAQR